MKYGTFQQAFLYALDLRSGRDEFMHDYLYPYDEGTNLFEAHPKYKEFLDRELNPSGLCVVPSIMNEGIDCVACSKDTIHEADYWVLYENGNFLFGFEGDDDEHFKTFDDFWIECLKEADDSHCELRVSLSGDKLK